MELVEKINNYIALEFNNEFEVEDRHYQIEYDNELHEFCAIDTENHEVSAEVDIDEFFENDTTPQSVESMAERVYNQLIDDTSLNKQL